MNSSGSAKVFNSDIVQIDTPILTTTSAATTTSRLQPINNQNSSDSISSGSASINNIPTNIRRQMTILTTNRKQQEEQVLQSSFEHNLSDSKQNLMQTSSRGPQNNLVDDSTIMTNNYLKFHQQTNQSELILYRLLERANLLCYFDTFVHFGGDDVQQLCDAEDDEFLEIMDLVGMAKKPLHVRRLQKTLLDWKRNPNMFNNNDQLDNPASSTTMALDRSLRSSVASSASSPHHHSLDHSKSNYHNSESVQETNIDDKRLLASIDTTIAKAFVSDNSHQTKSQLTSDNIIGRSSASSNDIMLMMMNQSSSTSPLTKQQPILLASNRPIASTSSLAPLNNNNNQHHLAAYIEELYNQTRGNVSPMVDINNIAHISQSNNTPETSVGFNISNDSHNDRLLSSCNHHHHVINNQNTKMTMTDHQNNLEHQLLPSFSHQFLINNILNHTMRQDRSEQQTKSDIIRHLTNYHHHHHHHQNSSQHNNFSQINTNNHHIQQQLSPIINAIRNHHKQASVDRLDTNNMFNNATTDLEYSHSHPNKMIVSLVDPKNHIAVSPSSQNSLKHHSTDNHGNIKEGNHHQRGYNHSSYHYNTTQDQQVSSHETPSDDCRLPNDKRPTFDTESSLPAKSCQLQSNSATSESSSSSPSTTTIRTTQKKDQCKSPSKSGPVVRGVGCKERAQLLQNASCRADKESNNKTLVDEEMVDIVVTQNAKSISARTNCGSVVVMKARNKIAHKHRQHALEEL